MSYIEEIINRDGLPFGAAVQNVDAPRGTAIIHHGYPGNRKSPTVQAMAKTFNRLNINTILPNTTHNYSDSGGDYREMTLAGHCDDLEDCVRFFMDHNDFVAPLILVGFSAGGYSGLSVSSRLEEEYRPALTIAASPLTSGQKYLDHVVEQIAVASNMTADDVAQYWEQKKLIPCNSDSGDDQLEWHWSVLQDWCQYDLGRDGIKPQNPTILIGGATDIYMPPKDIQAYADAVGVDNVHLIEGGNHCYENRMDVFEEALEAEVNKHLGLG